MARQPPDVIPPWARVAAYITSTSLGAFLLVHETLSGSPSLVIVLAGLALLGVVPAAALDRILKGGNG